MFSQSLVSFTPFTKGVVFGGDFGCTAQLKQGIAEHAIKTDYWDIDAMADAIYAIVKYPAMYKSLRELGRDEVNNIKWYDAGLKVRRIYTMVLGW